MPLTDVQLRRMEADYMDLDKEQKLTLVRNAIRAMPREMFPSERTAGIAMGNDWYNRQYMLGGIEQGERLAVEIANRGYYFGDGPNPITATVSARLLATALDTYGPIGSQFFENLYEQTTGPLDVDPPPRPMAIASPTINVKRSVLGWSDPVSAERINTGDRVIRLHRDDRMIFGATELLVWFNKHPDNPTNPLTRQAAPPSEREIGIVAVEEDAGPPPPEGGRRRRRKTRNGRKARKSTRRRR